MFCVFDARTTTTADFADGVCEVGCHSARSSERLCSLGPDESNFAIELDVYVVFDPLTRHSLRSCPPSPPQGERDLMLGGWELNGEFPAVWVDFSFFGGNGLKSTGLLKLCE